MSTTSTSSGWNRSTSTPKPAPKKPSAMRGVVAGLVTVCALGGLCLWMFSGGEDAPKAKADKERGRIKEVAPTATPRVRELAKKFEKPETVDEAMANVGGMVKPQMKIRAITPEEMARLTNRVFDTGVEQLMGHVFSRQLGDPPMPIPSIGGSDLENIIGILISKIDVKESDSEDIAQCKEAVSYAKQEMLKYLKEGGDPNEFLQYYNDQLMEAHRYRTEVVEQIHQILDEGDNDLARQFIDKINEKLEADGIKKIEAEQFTELRTEGPAEEGKESSNE